MKREIRRKKQRRIAILWAVYLLSGVCIAGAEDGDVFPEDMNGNHVHSGTTITIEGNHASLSNETIELEQKDIETTNGWGMIAGGLASEGDGIKGDSSHNTLRIYQPGNNKIFEIYGGFAKERSEYNKVDLKVDGETKITLSIIGGQAEERNASYNEIVISGKGNIIPVYEQYGIDIYGGKSYHEVSHNKVLITENVNIYTDKISGAYTSDHPANMNVLDINTTGRVVAVYQITGGYAQEGLASNNQLTISNGYIEANGVIGGYSPADNGGESTGNRLTLSGGNIKSYMIAGGYADQGNSNGNSVILENVKIEPNDQSEYAVVAAGAGGTAAKDNEMYLNSSLDLSRANLYGWRAVNGVDSITHSSNKLIINSTGNKVHGLYNFEDLIFTKSDMNEAALTVNGGGVELLPDSEGNPVKIHLPSLMDGDEIGAVYTLIDASKASTVKGLDELAKDYEGSSEIFSYKEGAVQVEGKSVVTATSDNKLLYRLGSINSITYGNLDWETNGTVVSLDNTKNFDLSNTKVDLTHLSFNTDSLTSSVTDKGTYRMTLLDTAGNTTLKEENIEGNKESSWTLGNALAGKGSASLEDNGNLIYTIHASEDSIKATEETHHILMGREGDMGLLSAGKDRIMNTFSTLKSEDGEPVVFASVGYGYDRYDTGSHIRSHNWTGVAGAGQEKKLSKGSLSYGLFYERGDGSYKTYDAGFTGKGDNDYNGGGFLLRYMTENKTYVEGSLRIGHMDSHGENMLHDADGNPLSYDTDSNYWGTHIGIGHIFELTDEKATIGISGVEKAEKDIDLYGKYFHTCLGGDTVTVNGIDYDLDAIDSDLIRIGTRFNCRQGRTTFYAGIAWDYEMSGKGTGTVSASGMNAPIRSTDTKGSSLMAEAGWKLESAHDNPWTLDVNLAAYGGQHRGIYGNVSVGYRF